MDDQKVNSREKPGEVLKAERLRRGLDVAKVAEQLHITRHYLLALENGEYHKLPAPIFAKGYMRSYAKLFDISEDTLLASLEADLPNEKVAAKKSRVGRLTSHRNEILGVLLLIALLSAAWVYSKFGL
jgi:cytoskeleton protein RodZ